MSVSYLKWEPENEPKPLPDLAKMPVNDSRFECTGRRGERLMIYDAEGRVFIFKINSL
jgi:hypothetical protein